MASRSGGGMGVMVALVVFILLSITFLLTTMLYYTNNVQATEQKNEANEALGTYVKPTERERDDVKRLASAAGREGKSVVVYLRDELQGVMQRVAGNRDLTRTDLEARLTQQEIPQGEALFNVLRDLRDRVTAAENRTSALQEQLDIASARVEEEVQTRQRLQTNYETAKGELQGKIDAIQALADSYKSRVDAAESWMNGRVTEIDSQYRDQVKDLTTRLEAEQAETTRLSDANAVLNERIRNVMGGVQQEATLPDGEIARILEDNNVFIDLGKKDHILLGMTFEVYGSQSDTRPSADGTTPRGKATIEITRIGDTTSTARVIRATPGRAVVEGDILVNAVYDRNKKYSFFVFGLFDLDGESGPSDLETDTVTSRITEWGGQIADEFTGSIDFLVLGVEPIDPLPLRPDPTPFEVRDWTNRKRLFRQYHDYVQQASKLSIPILNQNRLLTLIGYYE